MNSRNSDKKNKRDDYNSVMRELGPYMNLGIQMVIPILLGAFGGNYLDEKYDTSPIWTLVLAITGIAIGMYSFFKTVLGVGKKSNKDHQDKK